MRSVASRGSRRLSTSIFAKHQGQNSRHHHWVWQAIPQPSVQRPNYGCNMYIAAHWYTPLERVFLKGMEGKEGRFTSPLTGEGRVARKRQDVVEQKVERQPDARFPPEVQQHLGVERHAPAGVAPNTGKACGKRRHSPKTKGTR